MGHTFDFLPVPYLSARQLDFRLCDAKGQAINLHGGTISFSSALPTALSEQRINSQEYSEIMGGYFKMNRADISK
jgi:hypothetical protein